MISNASVVNGAAGIAKINIMGRNMEFGLPEHEVSRACRCNVCVRKCIQQIAFEMDNSLIPMDVPRRKKDQENRPHACKSRFS